MKKEPECKLKKLVGTSADEVTATLFLDLIVRISDKFCQILKEVLPLTALAIQLNYPKTKGKFCRDSQNERKALPSFFYVANLLLVSRFHNK